MATGQSPTLVFVHGSWHKPSCYEKVINRLENENGLRCVSMTLPSTNYNPNATFKDDVDAVRRAIIGETSQGRDVIVIAHSFGGMVGNSAIKDLTRPKSLDTSSHGKNPAASGSVRLQEGYVIGLILIATGFTITGLTFMDPFFGIPPPLWRVNEETGYAELVLNPRELFYHDLDDSEAEYWVSQLTTQSLKALFEGGEYSYSGWRDVPTWYIGTAEDKGLPIILQRVLVGFARSQGGTVHCVELKASHSPFLSMPREVQAVIMDAVITTTPGNHDNAQVYNQLLGKDNGNRALIPVVMLAAPSTWLKYGAPFLIGHAISLGFSAFVQIKRFWSGK